MASFHVGFNTLVAAIFFACVLALALHGVRGDHWDEWSEWSECSRTCDGGATYQERKCIRSYVINTGCSGERYRYDTCNIQKCPPGNQNFRAEQCAAYNNATYGGKLYSWLPYTDRKNPCALYCIAHGTRTVVRLAPKVLDGTRCRLLEDDDEDGGDDERRSGGEEHGGGREEAGERGFDMCISGKCWKVGCDYQLGSDRRVDLCGVCGGSNACLADGTQDRGRYQWREVGLSQCSASCGVGHQVSMFQCRDAIGKRNVHDRRCSGNSLPSGRTQACFRRRCPPAWKIFPWQPCSVSCGGGQRSRAVRCMDTLSDGRQQWLHDSFCPLPRPSLTQACNREICPTWYAGQWSPCSVTCGWGHQLREVVCRHEGDKFCEGHIRPVTRRNCTTNFPCPESQDPRAEHDEGSQRMRLVGHLEPEAFSSQSDSVHMDDTRNHDMSAPRYVLSEWSPCSVTCGKGLRQRFVRCQVRLLYIPDIIDLDDKECPGDKPAMTEECQNQPCFMDYEWRSMGMTPCDRSCLGGTQESIIECVHKDNGTIVEEDLCAKAPAIPKQRQICNDVPCPQRWRIGDFGPCSTTCGGGLMSREVSCIQEVSRGLSKILTLPDFMCQKPVPQRARQCNTQFCPADWATGFWSECSVTCGDGVELRPVVCQRLSRDGNPMDVKEFLCPPTERPSSERPCHPGDCPKVRIRRQSMRFFQLEKMDRVRLVVGTQAALLPGTSVVVSCPVRGISKRSVHWLKNQRPLRRSKRAFVSNNGKLRIRRSRPERDTANYTCVAGPQQAELALQFSDLLALSQESAVRKKYLLASVADSPQSQVWINSSAYHKDPFDRQRRPLHVVIGEWSECSATCDGGTQTRLVSCEIITKNYYERFPVKVCRKGGLLMPVSTRKCNLEPCVKWTVTRWTPCSITSCSKHGTAIQHRTVRCTAERNASYVSDSLCDVNRKPEKLKECHNSLCVPMWNTSDWSLCSADCGEEGVQIRMLTCIWESSGQPAGRACEGLERPLLSRACRRGNCKHSCRDVSSYCRMVSMMNLCRYPKFKYKCCKTCRRERRRMRKHLNT